MSSNTVTGTVSGDLWLMGECLRAGRDTLELALSHVRRACSREGALQTTLLDEQQVLAHELAIAAAELAAADVMLAYAEKAHTRDTLVSALTLAFCAEVLQSLHSRLFWRAAIYGLDTQSGESFFRSESLQRLLQSYLGPSRYSAVGELIATRASATLPSLLDEDKELMRRSFARFANEVVQPLAADIHRGDTDIPAAILEAAAALGCFALSIPERFGGLQPDDAPDSLGMLVVTEELSRASLGAAGSLITRPEILARALLAGGSGEQQQHWLPRIASGECLCAVAITEPDCGSDVAAVKLRASRVEGGWRLDGAKTWCTFAGKAQVLLVLARSDPDPASGHRGLSLFLVPKPAFEGHAFRHQQADGGALEGRAIATIGYRGMHSFELFFEGYLLADDALIGAAPGKGFYHTMAGFAGGRIQTAARASGVMQAAFDAALAYVRERRVFGRALAEYPLSQAKLGRMLAWLTAARQFSYAVADRLDSGGGQMEASLVKLFACRAAEWVTREAMQLHGGLGYAEESAVSRFFVDARVLSIFEGAEETLALRVIARELIAAAP